jgi:anti-sigma factor RsiW
MLREKLDAYLDGALETAERQALETQLASDPAAARLLAGMKSERVLRTAAYASYLPTTGETMTLVKQTLTRAFDTPLGRIGYWMRRGAAVAAALLIVAGTFTAGRMSASPKTYKVVETQTVYNVSYTDLNGQLGVREFSTLEERNEFQKELQQRGITGIAVRELTIPGHM